MPVPGQNPRSIYDDIADEQQLALNNQAAQSVAVAVDTNPEKAGQAQRVAAATGAGPDVAMHNMDDLQKSLAVQAVHERDLAAWNPMLARQLADPNFAAISHDQIDNLSNTGSLFQQVKGTLKGAARVIGEIATNPMGSGAELANTNTGRELGAAYATGHAEYERGMLGIKVKRGVSTVDDWVRLHDLNKQLAAPEEPNSLGGRFFGGLATMGGNLLPMVPRSLAVGAGGAAAGAGVGAVAAGIGAVPGALSGATLGFESEFAAQNYETMAGNAYLDMLERGVPEDRAQVAAGVVGAVNTALQNAALRVGGKALTGATGSFLNRALSEEAVNGLARPATATAVKDALVGWLGHTVEGTSEMGLQSIVSRAGDDYADKKGVAATAEDLASPEFVSHLWKSIEDAALTMGTINAFTGMVGFHADMSRAAHAERSASFFENLSQSAADSKVRDRNPDSYEQFIQNQAQGTGAESIYVDGRQMANLLNQSGIPPEKLEAALPGIQQQVAEASASGGDVTIPTEQYAARLAGTPLGDAMRAHMRLDPDAMSATEAVEFQQKQKELFAQVQEEAKRQAAANDDFAKSAKVVEKNVYDQLKATKTMPDDQARTNASFVRDFVLTQATRQGMSPEAFFEKYRYTVERAGEGVLDQSGESGKRGGFDPTTLTTMLGQKTDASTFLHETSHYFLSVYGDLAKDGAPGVSEDFGKLLNWFGVKDADTWHSLSLEEQRKYHEQFAYSYEKYLAEGKAPSIEAQGVFDRFTQWLKRVYKSVRDDVNTIYRQQHGEDLPILTGEVREVMDRMLASDEQIRQAEAVRNMEPVFKSRETSGMNDAEWQAYGDMARTATDTASAELAGTNIREMQWMSTAKGRLLKAMQAQHDTLREGVRKDVRDELARTEPVFKAQHFLRTGELEGEEPVAEHKMDTEAARKLLPEGREVKELFGMTKKGGLDPDIVAAAAGFPDGKAMIESILSSPSLKEATDAATDRRMLAEHGEMSTPEGMQAEVEKAVHNEARARLIAFEMRHAFNMTDSERVLVKAARETARKMLAQEQFADINPSAYAAREARAARQAQAAAARGDSEGVGRAKRDQLLQHALTTEALKVRDEADQHLRYLNKFDAPSKAVTKAIGADHMDAINELLAGYGLSAREKYSERSESMAQWINAEYQRTGVLPAVSDELVDRLGTMHWKDMSLAQLRDLRDAVKSLDYTGRRQTEVLLGEKAQSVDDFVGTVKTKLADLEHTPVEDLRARMKYAKGLDKISAQFLNLKSKLKSADAALLKMEQLFQWIDAGKEAGLRESAIEGPMQSLYRLASTAESRERDMRAASSKALRELSSRFRESTVNLKDLLDVPELPREGSGNRWYRGELLSMALNMGNESNKDKLLRGYGWDEMAAVSAINRLMSPAEMEYVQGVWDHLQTYGDGIRELQRRQTGVSPQMIEATPLITRHGTFKGGYYPVVFNDVLDENAAQNQARNADQLFENNYSKPATASGHTIARTSYVGPLLLDTGVIARHIDQVTHDLAWREAIVDMNKVLSDKRLTGELNQVYGREYTKQFRPWLQAMANDRVLNTAGDSAWEGFVRKARSNFTMVGIGFRLSTMAIHGTSALSNSLGEVGTKWFAKGMTQFVGIDRFKESRDFIYERSPEMAHRMDEADRNVHEVIDGINKQADSLTGTTAARKLYDGARKFAFRGVGLLDLGSALPTWMGAYMKAMAHEESGGLGMGEDASIEYANRAVRNAHGGGGTKDLSAVQRDKGVMSLATMFYGYWNHVYNRQRDLGKGYTAALTGQASVRDFPKLLARSWYYIVIPQIAHALLAGGNKREDDTMAGLAKESAEGVGLGFVSGVPILRDIAAAAVHGRDYSFTPIEAAGNAFVHTFRDIETVAQGETPKRGLQDTAETVGYALGLPTAQPVASAKFLWDVMNDDVSPETVTEWYRGILTGKVR